MQNSVKRNSKLYGLQFIQEWTVLLQIFRVVKNKAEVIIQMLKLA